METFGGRLRALTNLGLVVTGLGLGALVMLAWVEVLQQPGTSFVDAYWIGREPWTGLGIWLTVGGATATVLFGVAATLVQGGWVRRFLVLFGLAPATYWWAFPIGLVPGPSLSVIAPGRGTFAGWNPETLAWYWPEGTLIGLLLPAVFVATLALAARRTTPSAEIGPIHEQDWRTRVGQ
jgi:hypothetical protein